jgi:hypothetical protein
VAEAILTVRLLKCFPISNEAKNDELACARVVVGVSYPGLHPERERATRARIAAVALVDESTTFRSADDQSGCEKNARDQG